MIPIGYMYKRIALRPDWLRADAVVDIYSLCTHISEDFVFYINYWKHNGYWLFNSPDVMEDLARSEKVDMSGTILFYYEAYEREYNKDSKQWPAFAPDPAFVTDIQVPTDKHLEGFDIATFSARFNPECSPLSCNSLAETIPVNQHCLFDTFAEAKESLERGLFEHSEPGPYRIIAVYTL